MANTIDIKDIETLSLEEIDSLSISDANEIIDKVESNTEWDNTAIHATKRSIGTLRCW